MPKTYDALQIGDGFTFTRLITAEQVRDFAALSGDDNPIHLDPEAARAMGFERPIVHGTFVLGIASKVMGRDFPGPGSLAVSLSAKFLRPIPVDSEVTLEVKVAEKLERFRHVKMRIYAYMGGKMMMGGEAVVIPPKE